MRNSALATAALTSVALLSQTASATPATGDDGPSREEVRQRVDNLYNRAESDTGTFNATRAAAIPRQRAGSPADTGRGGAAPVTDRGRVDARTDDAPRRQADPAITDVARQWFDVARAKLGPTVPAALPTDRRQAPPAAARPARPVAAPSIPAQAAADRSAPELTAGSTPALPSAPVAQSDAGQQAAPRALPAAAAESGQSSLRTSKERIQRQLVTARDLLTTRTAQAAQPSTSLTAIESGPAEDIWPAPAPETRLDPDPLWQQQQPTATSMAAPLATETSLVMDSPLTTGTSFAMETPPATDPFTATGAPLTPNTSFGAGTSFDAGTPFAMETPPATDPFTATGAPLTPNTSFGAGTSFDAGTPFAMETPPATDPFTATATPPPMGAQLTTNTPLATNSPLVDASPSMDASIAMAPPTTAAPLPPNTPLPSDASLTFATPAATAAPTTAQPPFGTTAPFPTTAPFQTDGTSGAGIPLAPAAPAPASALAPAPAPVGLTQAPEAPAHEPKASRALAFARAQIGKPCVWGAAGPGSYDNAGLIQAAWRAAGVALPRATLAQAASGTLVPLADTRVGDLVFFYDDLSHVGLYIGNGTMIHAPGPGAYIREESVFYAGESAIRGAVRPA
ncbi:NlpC/P60 family protein [Streptomyces sp. AC555_RSS877]|uniref:NlpC/P60 family protein n=1 Tax=Streptomyces sp. AC555_RSS877 TaxID=2823688 RepID=UPI0027E50BCB|nr:NlpC/P60 family protein [Streptomyces sp. AC555_RSS877]